MHLEGVVYLHWLSLRKEAPLAPRNQREVISFSKVLCKGCSYRNHIFEIFPSETHFGFLFKLGCGPLVLQNPVVAMYFHISLISSYEYYLQLHLVNVFVL